MTDQTSPVSPNPFEDFLARRGFPHIFQTFLASLQPGRLLLAFIAIVCLTGAGLVLDALILVGFGVEIIIRIASQWSEPTRFLRQPWNLFDLALVIAAFIPLTAGFAGVLRMVRVLRVMRIVGRLPRLRLLLTSTILSIPSIFSITALLGEISKAHGFVDGERTVQVMGLCRICARGATPTESVAV